MVWVLIAVVVVLVLMVGGLLGLLARQRRARRLREDFGPEYEREVAKRGDQRAAERELQERRKRHDGFEIRPLQPSARADYRQRWEATQRAFVDDPGAAVGQASALLRQVMHERGYPVDGDFEQLAADVSVEHPVVVQNYRAAQAISMRAHNGQAGTEDLRQSLVHFRALFGELLAGEKSGSPELASRTDRPLPTNTRRSS